MLDLQNHEVVTTVLWASPISVAACYAVMKLIRRYSTDRKDNSKDSAEVTLYQHLSDQVKSLADDLNRQREVNSELLNKVSELSGKVIHLESVQMDNTKLKSLLSDREKTISTLTEKVIVQGRRIADLAFELKRMSPNKKFIRECDKDCNNRLLGDDDDPTKCYNPECDRRKHGLFQLDAIDSVG